MFTVSDADNYGGTGVRLADVTVTLDDGTGTIGEEVTGADGKAEFTDPSTDYSGPLNIGLALDSLRRTYADVRPSELTDTTLVLPGRLHQLLRLHLGALDTTDAFVLGYDTGAARALIGAWNTDAQHPVSLHQSRDRSLARLLVASEGLRDLYAASRPVTEETAKVGVDALVSIFTFKRAVDDIYSEGMEALRGDDVLLALFGKAFSLIQGAIGGRIVDEAKAGLPEWAVEPFDIFVTKTASEVGTWSATSTWDTPGLRRGIIEAGVAKLAAEVGDPVLASAFVAATRDDLGDAVELAEGLSGSGGVEQAHAAVQAHVATARTRADDFVAFSEAVRGTTDSWNEVADFLIIGGTLPPFKLLQLAGGVVKAIDGAALIGATGQGLFTLGTLATFDAPKTVALSFGTSAARVTPVTYVEAGAGSSGTSYVINDEYFDSAAALAAEVRANDPVGARGAGLSLLAEDEELEGAVTSRMLALQAVADTARSRPGFSEAFGSAREARSLLSTERALLFTEAVGYLAPGAEADAAVVADSVEAITVRVQTVLEAWEAAVEAAEAARTGLASPPYVVVTAHGVDAPVGAAVAPDAPLTLTATVQNVGDASTDVSVELVDTSDAVPVLGVGDAVRTVGTLGPGEVRELTWTVTPRDTSSAGTSVAGYRISPTASEGRSRSTFGSFQIADGGFVSLGDPAPSETSLSVWPNPSSGPVRVAVTVPVAQRVNLDVYDALGRLVLSVPEAEYPSGRTTTGLTTSPLSPGVYVLRVTADSGTLSTRFSVVR